MSWFKNDSGLLRLLTVGDDTYIADSRLSIVRPVLSMVGSAQTLKGLSVNFIKYDGFSGSGPRKPLNSSLLNFGRKLGRKIKKRGSPWAPI